MAMSPKDEEAFLNGEWVSVESSNVAAGMYEADGERLFLRFNNGQAFQYLGVDVETARSFARAASHGKWIWDTLRVRGTRDGSKYTYIPM